MKDVYETLEHENVSLSHLRRDEKEFLVALFKRFEEGANYLSFKQAYTAPQSAVFTCAKRLGKEPEETPLYKVCDDLAKQLGIGQGYLVREEVVRYDAERQSAQQELTTGQVAKLAGCTRQAVRKAIRTWRLKARKIGRLSLIMEKDATAFAKTIRPYHRKRHKQPGRVKLVHA